VIAREADRVWEPPDAEINARDDDVVLVIGDDVCVQFAEFFRDAVTSVRRRGQEGTEVDAVVETDFSLYSHPGMQAGLTEP
jgi:hypothetical protein